MSKTSSLHGNRKLARILCFDIEPEQPLSLALLHSLARFRSI